MTIRASAAAGAVAVAVGAGRSGAVASSPPQPASSARAEQRARQDSPRPHRAQRRRGSARSALQPVDDERRRDRRACHRQVHAVGLARVDRPAAEADLLAEAPAGREDLHEVDHPAPRPTRSRGALDRPVDRPVDAREVPAARRRQRQPVHVRAPTAHGRSASSTPRAERTPRSTPPRSTPPSRRRASSSESRRWRRSNMTVTSGCSERACSRARLTQSSMNGFDTPVLMRASLRTRVAAAALEALLEDAVDDLDHRVAGREHAQATLAHEAPAAAARACAARRVPVAGSDLRARLRGPRPRSHGPPSFQVTNTRQSACAPSFTRSAAARRAQHEHARRRPRSSCAAARATLAARAAGLVDRADRRAQLAGRAAADAHAPPRRRVGPEHEADEARPGAIDLPHRQVAREAQPQPQVVADLAEAAPSISSDGAPRAAATAAAARAPPRRCRRRRRHATRERTRTAAAAPRARLDARRLDQPPAIAGRITITSPPPTSVSRPSSTRTSSSLR